MCIIKLTAVLSLGLKGITNTSCPRGSYIFSTDAEEVEYEHALQHISNSSSLMSIDEAFSREVK